MVSVILICILNSINIAAFIILLVLLEPCLSKFLSATCLYRLWLVLLLALFLPLRITEGNSLFHIGLPQIYLSDKGAYYDDRQSNNDFNINQTEILKQKRLNPDLGNSKDISNNSLHYLNKESRIDNTFKIFRDITLLLSILWCVGFIILAIRGIRYYGYRKHLRRFLSSFDHSRFTAIYQQCIQELRHNSKKDPSWTDKVKIYQCPVIKSPMTIGVLRRIILLPYVEYSDKDFYFIIKHELIHIQRKDSFIKFIQIIVLSLNWYNPFCYVLSRRLEEWCETSCDELVLRDLSRSDRLCYGRLLLRFLVPHENKALIANMIGGKDYMKKRLMSIVKHRKKHSGNILVLMALLIVFTLAIVAVNYGAKASAFDDNEATGYHDTEPSAAPVNQGPDDTSNCISTVIPDETDTGQVAEADAADSTDTGQVAETDAADSTDTGQVAETDATDATDTEQVMETSGKAYGDTHSTDDLRETVVEDAIKAQSTPYLWGGNDLDIGVDSSGYVQAIYKEVGYTLPRTSREQASEFMKVSIDELKPGDLIFYGKAEDQIVNHVAIYIGEKKVIHATNSRDGIKISDYDYRPIISAERVITE